MLEFFKKHQLKTWELIKKKPFLFPAMILLAIAAEFCIVWLVENVPMELWMQVLVSMLFGLFPTLLVWRYVLDKKPFFKPTPKEIINFLLVTVIFTLLGLVYLQFMFMSLGGVISPDQALALMVIMVVGGWFLSAKLIVSLPRLVDGPDLPWVAAARSWKLTKGKELYILLLLFVYVVTTQLLFPLELSSILLYLYGPFAMAEAAALYQLLKKS